MNPAHLATRQSRAVLVLTLLFTIAGAICYLSLPSSIYPPLEFPRIVAVAHAGTTPAQSMTLTVARPIEQAIMEVPGIRRVRSRTFRGATEISAQFDPATDMVVALQQVQDHIAEIRGALPADVELQVERLTPAAFPMLALNLIGHALTGGTVRPRLLRDSAGTLARRRRGPRQRPIERHARDRGDRRSAPVAVSRPDGWRHRRCAQERESAHAGGPLSRERCAAPGACVRAVGVALRYREHPHSH